MKKYTLIGLLIAGLLLVIIFSSYAAENIVLRFAAGGLKGGWFPTAVGIADVVNKADSTIRIDVVPGGGTANAARVGAGEIEMAFSFPPFTQAAFIGSPPYDAFPDIRSGMKGLSTTLVNFVVTADTGLETLDGLINQKFPIKLVVERAGTSDEFCLSKILEFYRIDYSTIKKWGGFVRFIGYGDQVTAMKDKHANGLFQVMVLRGPSMIEMMTTMKDLRILKFSNEVVKYLKEKYFFSIGVIPKGSYYDGTMPEEDLSTAALVTELVFNKNVPEDVVYRITKILCENADLVKKVPSAGTFDPTQASVGLGAPLHPGAERYYKEAGYVK